MGVLPKDMGEAIDNLFYLPSPQPKYQEGRITGQIIYQDVYGNLISNIPAEALPRGTPVQVSIKGQRINGLSRTFNDPDRTGNDPARSGNDPDESSASGLIALAGSHGYLEVASPNTSAARILDAGEGEAIEVRTLSI